VEDVVVGDRGLADHRAVVARAGSRGWTDGRSRRAGVLLVVGLLVVRRRLSVSDVLVNVIAIVEDLVPVVSRAERDRAIVGVTAVVSGVWLARHSGM
jgi:hypothetical protein